MLARQFSLPTKTTLVGTDLRDWSDSNHIFAVGITPWLIAAVFTEIFGRIIPNWQRLSLQRETGYADLRRVMNIIGTVLAVVHAAWITFDLTYAPSGMIAPPEEFYLPSENQSSSLFIFVALMLGAILFKALVDACVPHSFLKNHQWLIAASLLLANALALVRQAASYTLFMDVQDVLRVAVHLLVCAMLVSFIFMKPQFVWRTETDPSPAHL